MSKLPSVTGKEVIAALRKIGFDVVRIKGSHHFLKHSDGRATVTPVKQLGRDLLTRFCVTVK